MPSTPPAPSTPTQPITPPASARKSKQKPGKDQGTKEAYRFLGLAEEEAARVKEQVRQIAAELDIMNQSSDRWLDGLARCVVGIPAISRHRRWRAAWNRRDETEEGKVFLKHLKALLTAAGTNHGDAVRKKVRQEGRAAWVVDCYHVTDDEESCVSILRSYSPLIC